GESSTTYDTMDISVSIVGGATSVIYTVSSTTGGWMELVTDVSAYCGNEIQVEFFFDTYDSVLNDYQGAYVDDVEIIASVPCVEPCVNDGDVNDDGSVTAGDAQMAFQIALGQYTPTTEEFCAADCNGDESVTAGDAQQIFMMALGMTSCVDPLPITPTPTPTPTPTASPWPTPTPNPGDNPDHRFIEKPAVNPAPVVQQMPDATAVLELNHDGGGRWIADVRLTGHAPAISAFTVTFALDARWELVDCITGPSDPGWMEFGCADPEPGQIRLAGYTLSDSEAIPAGSTDVLATLILQGPEIATDTPIRITGLYDALR
ncbi:MAG TPA: dockerin type I repeat-containing protein, partial [bacterium]|nr:dockerin type I repeat-containing protein [bacterium]